MEAPHQPDHDAPDPIPPEGPEGETGVGLDIATIGLLIFFIALIGIVAGLLLLSILAG